MRSVLIWARRGAISLAGVVLIALLGLPIYVFPPQDDPRGADLLYVIGPPVDERVAKAHELRAEGLGPTILVSVTPPGQWPSMDSVPACREQGVVCEIPTPLTTKGEAAMLATQPASVGAHKTVVITSTYQVLRARYVFSRCQRGDVAVIGVKDAHDAGPVGGAVHLSERRLRQGVCHPVFRIPMTCPSHGAQHRDLRPSQGTPETMQ